MEIVTYVLSGAVAHTDSMGNSGVLRPGEVQVMSAGSGLRHSEMNASTSEELHLLQIWIMPAQKDTRPSYDERAFSEEARRAGLCVVASPDGRDGSLPIGQDAVISAVIIPAGQTRTTRLGAGRGAWIQLARGAVDINGTPLAAGDGARVENESTVTISAEKDAELLYFDLG